MVRTIIDVHWCYRRRMQDEQRCEGGAVVAWLRVVVREE
jgi:hypothetical protein